MKYYYNTDVSITDTKTSYTPPLFKTNIPSTCGVHYYVTLLIQNKQSPSSGPTKSITDTKINHTPPLFKTNIPSTCGVNYYVTLSIQNKQSPRKVQLSQSQIQK